MEQFHPSKNYKRRAFVFLVLMQLIFFGSVLLCVYALLTLDIYLISVLLLIVILQIPICKSQRLVDIIKRYNHPAAYFESFNVIQDSVFPPVQKCIFAFHPHSIFGMGILGSSNFPGKAHFGNLVVLSSNFALNIPILGGLMKLWGVGSASNANVKQLMRQGKNIGVLPGGFQQATITSAKEMRCWITQRKGFIKYALEHGYKICPTIVLGQHQGFWTFQALQSLRLFFNRVKLPAVFFWNKYSGIFLPTSMNITVITGKLISRRQTPNQGSPTNEQIDEIHRQYVQQIERLYNKYKYLNGGCRLKFY